MRLPTDEEVVAKATELGLLSDDGVVPRRERSKIVNLLMAGDKTTPEPEPQGGAGVLVSKSMTPLAGGMLVIEARFFSDNDGG